MLVRDVMTPTVLTVGPAHTVRQVAAADGRPPGRRGRRASTPTPTARASSPSATCSRPSPPGQDLDTELAADHLTPDAVVGTPDWDLDKAAAAMVAGGFRHLVICDGDDVVGVLSVRDIVRVVERSRASAERPPDGRQGCPVDGRRLVFRYPDPDGSLRGVRLQQDVRLPGRAARLRRARPTTGCCDVPAARRRPHGVLLRAPARRRRQRVGRATPPTR